MWRVAILEDNELEADGLEALLAASTHAASLSPVCRLAADAPLDALADDISRQGIDILITDVRLGRDDANGIELVGRLERELASTQVIYASGYLEHAPESYHTRHVWFLAKPIEAAELDRALGRAIANLEVLREELIVLKSRHALTKVVPRQVSYVESNRRKLEIHERGRVVETYGKLSEMEGRLPTSFVRCHKSFLVNMDCIERIDAHALVLRDGTELPVSQSHGAGLRARFVDYMTERG